MECTNVNNSEDTNEITQYGVASLQLTLEDTTEINPMEEQEASDAIERAIITASLQSTEDRDEDTNTTEAAFATVTENVATNHCIPQIHISIPLENSTTALRETPTMVSYEDSVTSGNNHVSASTEDSKVPLDDPEKIDSTNISGHLSNEGIDISTSSGDNATSTVQQTTTVVGNVSIISANPGISNSPAVVEGDIYSDSVLNKVVSVSTGNGHIMSGEKIHSSFLGDTTSPLFTEDISVSAPIAGYTLDFMDIDHPEENTSHGDYISQESDTTVFSGDFANNASPVFDPGKVSHKVLKDTSFSAPENDAFFQESDTDTLFNENSSIIAITQSGPFQLTSTVIPGSISSLSSDDNKAFTEGKHTVTDSEGSSTSRNRADVTVSCSSTSPQSTVASANKCDDSADGSVYTLGNMANTVSSGNSRYATAIDSGTPANMSDENTTTLGNILTPDEHITTYEKPSAIATDDELFPITAGNVDTMVCSTGVTTDTIKNMGPAMDEMTTTAIVENINKHNLSARATTLSSSEADRKTNIPRGEAIILPEKFTITPSSDNVIMYTTATGYMGSGDDLTGEDAIAAFPVSGNCKKLESSPGKGTDVVSSEIHTSIEKIFGDTTTITSFQECTVNPTCAGIKGTATQENTFTNVVPHKYIAITEDVRETSTKITNSISEDNNISTETRAAWGTGGTTCEHGTTSEEDVAAISSDDVTNSMTSNGTASINFANAVVTETFTTGVDNAAAVSGPGTASTGEDGVNNGSGQVIISGEGGLPTTVHSKIPIDLDKTIIHNGKSTINFMSKDSETKVAFGNTTDTTDSNIMDFTNVSEIVTRPKDANNTMNFVHGDIITTTTGKQWSSEYSSSSDSVTQETDHDIHSPLKELITPDPIFMSPVDSVPPESLFSRDHSILQSNSTHGDTHSEVVSSDLTFGHCIEEGRNVYASLIDGDGNPLSNIVTDATAIVTPSHRPVDNYSLLSREINTGDVKDTITSSAGTLFIHLSNSGKISIDIPQMNHYGEGVISLSGESATILQHPDSSFSTLTGVQEDNTCQIDTTTTFGYSSSISEGVHIGETFVSVTTEQKSNFSRRDSKECATAEATVLSRRSLVEDANSSSRGDTSMTSVDVETECSGSHMDIQSLDESIIADASVASVTLRISEVVSTSDNTTNANGSGDTCAIGYATALTPSAGTDGSLIINKSRDITSASGDLSRTSSLLGDVVTIAPTKATSAVTAITTQAFSGDVINAEVQAVAGDATLANSTEDIVASSANIISSHEPVMKPSDLYVSHRDPHEDAFLPLDTTTSALALGQTVPYREMFFSGNAAKVATPLEVSLQSDSCKSTEAFSTLTSTLNSPEEHPLPSSQDIISMLSNTSKVPETNITFVNFTTPILSVEDGEDLSTASDSTSPKATGITSEVITVPGRRSPSPPKAAASTSDSKYIPSASEETDLAGDCTVELTDAKPMFSTMTSYGDVGVPGKNSTDISPPEDTGITTTLGDIYASAVATSGDVSNTIRDINSDILEDTTSIQYEASSPMHRKVCEEAHLSENSCITTVHLTSRDTADTHEAKTVIDEEEIASAGLTDHVNDTITVNTETSLGDIVSVSEAFTVTRGVDTSINVTRSITEDRRQENDMSTCGTIISVTETPVTVVNSMTEMNLTYREVENIIPESTVFKEDITFFPIPPSVVSITSSSDAPMSRSERTSLGKPTELSLNSGVSSTDFVLATLPHSRETFPVASSVMTASCSEDALKETSIIGTILGVADACTSPASVPIEGTLDATTVPEDTILGIATGSMKEAPSFEANIVLGKYPTSETTTALGEVTSSGNSIVPRGTLSHKGFRETSISQSDSDSSLNSISESPNFSVEYSTHQSESSSEQMSTSINASLSKMAIIADITTTATPTDCMISSGSDTFTSCSGSKSDETHTAGRVVVIDIHDKTHGPRASTPPTEAVAFVSGHPKVIENTAEYPILSENTHASPNTTENSTCEPETLSITVPEDTTIVSGNKNIVSDDALSTFLDKLNGALAITIEKALTTAKPKESTQESQASVLKEINSVPGEAYIITPEETTTAMSKETPDSDVETPSLLEEIFEEFSIDTPGDTLVTNFGKVEECTSVKSSTTPCETVATSPGKTHPAAIFKDNIDNTEDGPEDTFTVSEELLIDNPREISIAQSADITESITNTDEATNIIHRKLSTTLPSQIPLKNPSGEYPAFPPSEDPPTVSVGTSTIHKEALPVKPEDYVLIARTSKTTPISTPEGIASTFQGKCNTIKQVIPLSCWSIMLIDIMITLFLAVGLCVVIYYVSGFILVIYSTS